MSTYSPTTPTDYDKSPTFQKFGFFDEFAMSPAQLEIASHSPTPISLDYPLTFSGQILSANAMPDRSSTTSNRATPESDSTGASTRMSPGAQNNSSYSPPSSSPIQRRHTQQQQQPIQSPQYATAASHQFNQPTSEHSEWFPRSMRAPTVTASSVLPEGATSASSWGNCTSSDMGATGSQWPSLSALTSTSSESTNAQGQQDFQLREFFDSIIRPQPQLYANNADPTPTSNCVQYGSDSRSRSNSTTPPTPSLANDTSPSSNDNTDAAGAGNTNVGGMVPLISSHPYQPFSQPTIRYYPPHDPTMNAVHRGQGNYAQGPNHSQTLAYGQRPQMSFPMPANFQGSFEGQNTTPYPGKPPHKARRLSSVSQTGSTFSTSPPMSTRKTSISSHGPSMSMPSHGTAPMHNATRTSTSVDSTLVGDSYYGHPMRDFFGSTTPFKDLTVQHLPSWPYDTQAEAQIVWDPYGIQPQQASSSPPSPPAPAAAGVSNGANGASASGASPRYGAATMSSGMPLWAQPSSIQRGGSSSMSIPNTSPGLRPPPPTNVKRGAVARTSSPNTETSVVATTIRPTTLNRPTTTTTPARVVVEREKVISLSLPSPVDEPTVPLDVRVAALPRDKRAMFERACGPRWTGSTNATSQASTSAVGDVIAIENARVVEAIYALLSSEELAKQREIPDELVEPLLARVPLTKTVAKRGSRGGAAGYACLWAGCAKPLIKRLDHAKNHIREHCKSKPFTCGISVIPGEVTVGRGCGQKFLRIDDLKRHQKSHCSVLKSGPTRRPRAVRGVYHGVDDDDEEHDSEGSPLKGDDDDDYRPTDPRLHPAHSASHAQPDAASYSAATTDATKSSTTREMVHRVRGERQRAAAKQAAAAVSAVAAYLVDEGSSDGDGLSPATMTSGTGSSPVDLGRLQTSNVRGGGVASTSYSLTALHHPATTTTTTQAARDANQDFRLEDLVEMDDGDLDGFEMGYQKVWLGYGALMASCSSRLITVRVRPAAARLHPLLFIALVVFIVIIDMLDGRVEKSGWRAKVPDADEVKTERPSGELGSNVTDALNSDHQKWLPRRLATTSECCF